MRTISTSNSFDSKSSIPNFGNRFQMSAEATKLFQTLQQSPLPLEVGSFSTRMNLFRGVDLD